MQSQVSYPTRSFEFLKKLTNATANGAWAPPSSNEGQATAIKLKVLTVGAGLAGLATAGALKYARSFVPL